MTRPALLLTLAAPFAIGPLAIAQPEAARHYPPDLQADFLHMRLDITIEDMNTPILSAVQELEFQPIARPLTSLTLDARLMEIVEARSPGRTVVHTHDARHVTYTFDPPIPAGETAELYTRYIVTDPPEGLYWTPMAPEWPDRAPQIHTQGEPQTSSYWFPCHDYPNDRLTTEIIATVPEGFIVSSNGRLVAQEPLEGAVRYHWLQDKPHVNYLVSLIVGKFDVVDIGTPDLPMPVYVPPGRARDVKGTYGRTPDMIAFFEHRFDEPYPWDRYAQLVVWNFNFGGMENTSATTMHDTAILSADGRLDYELTGLIAHELAHQWFGDLITCDSWDHIWLNEGFATYSESLWLEHDQGRDAYQSDMLANFDSLIASDTGAAPEAPGMVSNVYRRPLDTFFKPANPYSKGACVLHMLRMRVGDVPFFAGIAAYVDQHKLGLVETPDFRKAMEEATGATLERFFDQWTTRPGIPRLDIESTWDDQASELVIDITQAQTINGYNPAYVFTLPVWIRTDSGSGATAMIEVNKRHTQQRVALASRPTLIAFDPGMHVLAEMTIDQPAELWREQVKRGPSMYARVQAVRALAQAPSDEQDTTLLARVAGAGEYHKTVRREAVAALGRRGQEDDVHALLAVASDLPAIRVERLRALVRAGETRPLQDEARAAAIGRAAADRAATVRIAAIEAIGALTLDQHFAVLETALSEESQHDAVRRAALRALAAFKDDPRALPLVIPYTRRGYLSNTRGAAIDAAVRLGAPADDFEHIYTFLGDYERRVHRAAGEAIAQRALPEGLQALRSFSQSTPDPREREDAQDWIEALESRLSDDQ